MRGWLITVIMCGTFSMFACTKRPVPPRGTVDIRRASSPRIVVPVDLVVEVLKAAREQWHSLDEFPKKSLLAQVRDHPRFARALNALLKERGYKFFFSTEAAPGEPVGVLIEAVRRLSEHAITPRGYPTHGLKEACLAIVDRGRDTAKLRSDLERKLAPLFELATGDGDLTREAVQAAVGQTRGLDSQAVGRFRALFGRYVKARKRLIEARAEAEILASVVFFKYVLDMKLLKVASPFEAEKHPELAGNKYFKKLVEGFWEFAKSSQEFIENLPPKHPYYRALMRELARYRFIAQSGGFVRIPMVRRLSRGAHGKVVRLLKRRLAQEGYFHGDQKSALFDEELEAAVKDYQSKHGFEATGVVLPKHIRSLNVSAKRRARQIALSLQRWRESDVRPDEPLYWRVDIPEFMLEVWEDGKLVRKHKVIVGNNNWDKDIRARIEGRINRTKMFSSQVEEVVLNPRWYVPVRIQRRELDLELMKEPDYYVRHHYKVKVHPNGSEEVYQESGDENALGRVKFVFPNPYGIFMHDTPEKGLFKTEIRAYSHGCIRVEHPVELATYLLHKVNGMSRDEVMALLATEKVRVVKLAKPVPIFVEYNSVGVDERGRAMFFSDIYRYDRDYFAGKIPYSEEELKLLMRKIPRVD